MYFFPVIILFISVSLFFSSSSSLLNNLYLIDMCLHSFSKILDHLYYHYWIIFQVDCLTPCHLVVLMEFYLVPSSGTYSSPVSFCLTSCVAVSILQAAGFWFFLFLLCAPCWMKMSRRLVQTSWWEGPVPSSWWMELGLVPFVERAMSWVVFLRQLYIQKYFKQPFCWWV